MENFKLKIQPLNIETYRKKKLSVKYHTPGYVDLVQDNQCFQLSYHECEQDKQFEDELINDWLEEPLLFGAFFGEQEIGLIEGSIESWNNRFRITNLWVDEKFRQLGIGTQLMTTMIHEAKKLKARMVVLETQSCNIPALRFYQEMGFCLIGFDTHCYSNDDIKKHEIRLEMGMVIHETN